MIKKTDRISIMPKEYEVNKYFSMNQNQREPESGGIDGGISVNNESHES